MPEPEPERWLIALANLTGHTVKVRYRYAGTQEERLYVFEPSNTLARIVDNGPVRDAAVILAEDESRLAFDAYRQRRGRVEGLPPETRERSYIVTADVGAHPDVRHRADLLVPGRRISPVSDIHEGFLIPTPRLGTTP